MKHKDLVQIGHKWLLKHNSWKLRCNFVVTEFRYAGSEEPDIFGLMGGNTLMVEVKVSRGDFIKDSLKRHRMEDTGIGNFRYFLCPAYLINSDELPDGWGLLWFKDGEITILKEARFRTEPNIKAQQNLMYSIIRRLAKHKHLNKHWIK